MQRLRSSPRAATRAKSPNHVLCSSTSPRPKIPPSHPMPASFRSPTPIFCLRNSIRHLSLPSRLRPQPTSKPTAPPVPKPHPTPTPTLTILQRLRANTRTTISILIFFASWFPAWSFFTNNVFCIMSVTGPSMSPFLNTDYGSSLVSDRVWVNMWRARQGLERGMVVVYRYVCQLEDKGLG